MFQKRFLDISNHTSIKIQGKKVDNNVIITFLVKNIVSYIIFPDQELLKELVSKNETSITTVSTITIDNIDTTTTRTNTIEETGTKSTNNKITITNSHTKSFFTRINVESNNKAKTYIIKTSPKK